MRKRPSALPTLEIRKAQERGHADHGWLDTRHTFSFADYYDPDHVHFRQLRVINEDVVQPGQGFPPHSHRDMEIITYVLGGAVQHRDSMGNERVIKAGEVQCMTAGTGVTHSEYNPSATEPLHFLQIWIFPARKGLAPSYRQREFPAAEKRGRLRPIVTPDGRDGSLAIHQDASLYASVLAPGERVVHDLAPDRYAWIQVARGSVRANGRNLETGDGAAAAGAGPLTLEGVGDAELLLFDLA